MELAQAISSGECAHQERRAFRDLLDQVGDVSDTKELAEQLVVIAWHLSGCEAVAVRLKVGQDYPYAAFRGFPEAFITIENELCCKDREGHLIRDRQLKPILACQCGRVLAGQADPNHVRFTERGSLIIASHHELKCQDRTRRCQLVGYETMGLVPIRLEGVTYGLIQCNDPRPGIITPEAMDRLENLAASAARLLQMRMVQESA